MGEVAKLRLATVIPVLNEVDYIEACLDGLLHQTIDPASHMVFVLDGGSIDGTPALVERITETVQLEEAEEMFVFKPDGLRCRTLAALGILF